MARKTASGLKRGPNSGLRGGPFRANGEKALAGFFWGHFGTLRLEASVDPVLLPVRSPLRGSEAVFRRIPVAEGHISRNLSLSSLSLSA